MSVETIEKILLGWLLGSIFTGWILSRWFRYLRGEYEGETPWETSALDRDVEVRWKDGQVESRLKPRR